MYDVNLSYFKGISEYLWAMMSLGGAAQRAEVVCQRATKAYDIWRI